MYISIFFKWVFSANRWLDKDEGDGRIDIELTPVKNTSFDTKGRFSLKMLPLYRYLSLKFILSLSSKIYN